MKETYKNTKTLLEKIQYDKYCRTICSDLKVIAEFNYMWTGTEDRVSVLSEPTLPKSIRYSNR
jgi:hypothetical protein